MIIKKRLLFIICFLVITLTFKSLSKSNLSYQQLAKFPEHSMIIMIINHHKLNVELANTQRSRERGLSYRKEIGSDGMLFVYPYPQQLYFWMKDMRFDLDLIWLRNDTVVAVMPDLPHPRITKDEKLPLYTIDQPVDAVLEIPSGYAKHYGIEKGLTVRNLSKDLLNQSN